jgi:hypothetical protein
LAISARSIFAQPVVVFTEEFDEASDVDRWTFEPDLGGLQAGGIQWSSTEGLPAGSLELINPGGGPNTVSGFSLCLPFGGDQPWAATADAKPIAPVICGIQLVNHTMADCSDNGVGGFGAAHEVQDTWSSLHDERGLFAQPPPDPTRALRLVLKTGNSSQEPGSCVFDNIVITGSTAPPSVAVHGNVSLALLAALVVGVGLWLLWLR